MTCHHHKINDTVLTALHPKSHSSVCGCCGGCGGAVAATTPVQRRAGAIGMFQGWHFGGWLGHARGWSYKNLT